MSLIVVVVIVKIKLIPNHILGNTLYTDYLIKKKKKNPLQDIVNTLIITELQIRNL